VYDAFVAHCKKYGETPSLATLVSETDTGFTFEEVEESAETLVRKLREYRAKTEKQEALQRIALEWAQLGADEVTQRIKAELDAIDAKYGLAAQTQTDWTTDGQQRVLAYQQRKSAQQKLIYTGFDSWNREIGPLRPGDYVVLFAPPKTGKTHMSRAFLTLPAVRQGFNVLDYALEQPRAEIEAVLDSLESAYRGVFTYNGQPSGFSERNILRGDLDPSQEQLYYEFVSQDRSGYGKYIIKTLEDADMDVCNLDKIESDIDLYKPDVVLVDQASLMTYERVRDSKTGGAAEATSRRFRRMCVRKGVVGIMLVQAQVEPEKEEDGIKVLSPPDASKIKTTKAFVEDATILVTMDSTKGKAILKCDRGRMGGAGFTVDLQFWPNYGIVREIEAADLF
jgi:replicative DNA helicase